MWIRNSARLLHSFTTVATGISDLLSSISFSCMISKISEDGTVLRREDGKILKPEGWTEPDIASILSKYDLETE